MPTEVTFGRRQVANEIRDRLTGFLADSDDRRTNTVVLQDRVPDSMVQRVREEAADSRQAEANKAGQVALTAAERSRIDFSRPGVNVPKARSIKGIAQAEGVDDWIQFADFELTVDENRNVLERASRQERGRAGMGRTQENRDLRRAAGAKRQRREQAETAKDPAFRGDSEAVDFLREEERFEDDLFDISFRGASGPSGRDFERLEEAHESRSQRAQTMDERRTAEVTRDPLLWAQNKDRYDFPGIDTIDPQAVHDERIERARQQDEDELAPIADSREQWARNPDRYDWPGVDTPAGYETGFIDDRAEQGSMVDFGMDTDGTVFRESREDVARATEFGVDDRTLEGDDTTGESEQRGFAAFGGGTRENESLLDRF